MQKRSVPVSIILSMVTCGIYLFIWLYQILTDLYYLNHQENKAGMDILLSLVTCGIYFIYLNYKMGALLSTACQIHGKPYSDDKMLFVVLAIFNLSVVNLAIAQSQINTEFIDGGYGGGPAGGPPPPPRQGNDYY